MVRNLSRKRIDQAIKIDKNGFIERDIFILPNPEIILSSDVEIRVENTPTVLQKLGVVLLRPNIGL